MQNWRFRRMGWRSLCLALLALGIFFRFVNLDKKVYWHDEVFTSLEVSGYSRAELVNKLFVGREVDISELQAYQHINPERGMGAIITTLAQEDPQHPPLYMILLRGWLDRVGQSIATTRALSAIFSLLVFPCLYWLCLELSGSSQMGWMAIALISVSPFHVLFAQEAREYCLWTVTTLLCSAALLRALRLQTRRSWLVYTLSLTVSLYTFLFSILVAIGHGIYVLATGGIQQVAPQKFQIDKRAIAFLISMLYALIAFAPWLLVVIANFRSITTGTVWTDQTLPLSIWLRIWMLNFSRVFVDFNPFIDDLSAYLLIIPILVLEGIAVYFLCCHAPKKIWLFILTLIGSVALPIALADLILGGQRSTATRYLVPFELGLLLLVTYFLADQIQSSNSLVRKVCRLGLAALISVEILSCAVSAQSEVWWNKSINYFAPQMAEIVNRAGDRPEIVSDAFERNPGDVISLSYLLSQKVKFILLPEIKDSTNVAAVSVVLSAQQKLPSDLFFLGLPDTFLKQFSENNQVKIVPAVSNPSISEFWRVQQ